MVSISGSNLSGATAVSIGGAAATSFTVNSATSISATVGRGATGTISVTTPGGTATSCGNFTFFTPPTITGFTPSSGGVLTVLLITGTNFTGATAVTIAETSEPLYLVLCDNCIIVIVTKGATGTITVTTPGGSVTSTDIFTFLAPPIITSFSPGSGGRGTVVTITGMYLTCTTAVTIGGTAATSFTVNSDSSLSATVGNGSTGKLTVTNPCGIATSCATFTYIPAPTITSFTPNSDPVGTLITITGTNFTGATAVNIGGMAAASFTVNSATSISATAGAGTTGAIAVTTPGGTATSTGVYTFCTIPVANPDACTVVAGNTLSIAAPGVLANDTNSDGRALSAALDTNVSHGALTLNANGSFSYTPSTGYSGIDSFTYTAYDAYASSAPATVTIIVYSVPVANAASYTVVDGNTLNVVAPGVLATDTNADGYALSAQLVGSGTSNGQLTLNTDGSFSYTPNAGFSGTDTFAYTATDGYATSAPAMVTITVSIPAPTITSFTPSSGIAGT